MSRPQALRIFYSDYTKYTRTVMSLPLAQILLHLAGSFLPETLADIILACVAGGFLGFLNFYYRTRAEEIKEGASKTNKNNQGQVTNLSEQVIAITDCNGSW